ncbi:hypothetical protein [Xanthomonas arboricola]|uniref:hypothetical protein n=1 Tax=Xanthomonas arboricola TaxID=56448 RepID=UPI0025B17C91|nr:hypothetical protein [Xanthomonas arboricola]MDN0209240.1 hypothetical protein [Xanthomonas arboricola pv. corylina]MDN0213621.1 hypothetical protein [Xanthomonas arboricola pv. corylina]
MKPWLKVYTVIGSLISLGGCNAFLATGKVPTASDRLIIPRDLPNQPLFDCAEISISKLSATDSSWSEVTRKDSLNGVLESGNFEEKNLAGFRMRIERPQGSSQAKITLKGGGAYFFDLGVDKAMNDFKTLLGSCVASQQQ